MRIGGRSPPFPDVELIRALAALLTETGLTEIEYALGDRRIRVARAAAGTAPPGGSSVPSAAAGSIEHPGAVRAPIVGTAYLAPQPGASPGPSKRRRMVPHHSISIRTAPYSTGWASATTICARRPGRWARIWFMTFIASMINSGWPSAMMSPSRTKGGAPGCGAR